MNKDPTHWYRMAGTLVIMVGTVWALEGQATGLNPLRVFSCVALGAVGVWLLTQANRERPS